MARAMWKATLAVGDERVGVKMYAAVEDRALHFRLLHAADGGRVRQRMVHPRTGDEVEDVRRGVEIGRGRFVLLDEEEREALEPEPSREIRVDACLPPDAIDARWYERPYWLAPDEGEAERYAGLVQALADSGREGLARWTLRKRPYRGALRVHGPWLGLVALRSAQEILQADGWEAPGGRELLERERELARRLIESLAGDLAEEEPVDEHRMRVLALIAAKRAGKQVELERWEPETDDDESLLASLEASLAG